MVKQGEEDDRALNSYFKVGSSEGDLRYVNYYIAVIFQYFWKPTRLHAAPALQYWNSSSGKWEINQKQRQQSSSPISKPDAAERCGSVSADEQAQVAVWKSRNTETELRPADGNQKAQRREGDGAQSRKTEAALGPEMVQQLPFSAFRHQWAAVKLPVRPSYDEIHCKQMRPYWRVTVCSYGWWWHHFPQIHISFTQTTNCR